ncbi:MAG: AtpZ/AtpI family protein [Aridibacter sp.]
MIKSLFGEDEELKKEESTPEIIGERTKTVENSEENLQVLNDISKSEIDTQNDVVSEEDIKTEDGIETIDEIRTAIETGQIPPRNADSVRPFEVNRPIGQPQFERKIEDAPIEDQTLESSELEDLSEKSERELELERKLAGIEAELLAEKEYHNQIGEDEKNRLEAEQINKQNELEKLVEQSADLPIAKVSETKSTEIKTDDDQKIHISHKDFKPESKTETIRKSGLAWSAAIALFGSIVFMMILGWFADQLFGSSPWGIMVGIVIGAIIGFIQFFRMTSQIINPKPNDFEKVSLTSNLEKSKQEVAMPTNDLLENQEIEPKEDILK